MLLTGFISIQEEEEENEILREAEAILDRYTWTSGGFYDFSYSC